MNRFYRRHLPHWLPDHYSVFVTWNLKGALPKAVLDRLIQARDELSRTSQKNEEEILEETRLRNASLCFRLSEEYLDQAKDGPQWLKDQRVAESVTRTILDGAEKWYDLFAFVVMSNHVHILITPKVELDRITGGIKKKTGRLSNALLGRSGSPFWQDESFDHWPRSGEKFMKALNYIEHNPVKAGMCASPELWPWSSAAMRQDWKIGEKWSRSAL